jgi:thiamine pyrophosphokinase
VSILLYLDSLGKKGSIIDDYSEMEIVSDEPVSICDQYSFFSLLNITGCAKGITITGAKYPLDGGEITCEYQYGISNEVLPGRTAQVAVASGKLLLIKVR